LEEKERLDALLDKHGFDKDVEERMHLFIALRKDNWFQAPQASGPVIAELSSPLKNKINKIDLLEQKLSAIGATYAHSPSTTREQYTGFVSSGYHKVLPSGTPLWFPAATDIPKIGRSKKKLFTNFLPDSAPEDPDVQDWWTKVLQNVPKDYKLEAIDRHTSPSVGTRKPDTVIYLADQPKSVFNIVALGDNKRRRSSDDFHTEEKGHLVELLKTLFEEQPFRTSVTGFLSDGYLIQFFMLSREEREGPCTLTEAPVMFLGGDGGKAFIGLLGCGPEQLGYSPPKVSVLGKPVKIVNLLGTGASSLVYAGEYLGKDVVVKHFRSLSIFRFTFESHNLTRLAPTIPAVPELLATSDQNDALILSPIGIPFATKWNDIPKVIQGDDSKALLSFKHFASLIEILESAHSEFHLAHRDVALNNMFLHPETKELFLNDWGCASEIGKPIEFAGTLLNAPITVLEQLVLYGKNWRNAKVCPRPQDDLLSVVCCVFQAVCGAKYEAIRDFNNDPKKILSFWKSELVPDFWLKMLKAAEAGDTLGLTHLISHILP